MTIYNLLIFADKSKFIEIRVIRHFCIELADVFFSFYRGYFKSTNDQRGALTALPSFYMLHLSVTTRLRTHDTRYAWFVYCSL